MTGFGTKRKLPDAPICGRCWLESRHRRRGADPSALTEGVIPAQAGIFWQFREIPACAGMTPEQTLIPIEPNLPYP